MAKNGDRPRSKLAREVLDGLHETLDLLKGKPVDGELSRVKVPGRTPSRREKAIRRNRS